MTIDKTYQPQAIEKKWYQEWESKGYFSPKKCPESYCIMLPPPNVTGTLHMGHAFQDTIMDALIRYHRMMGYQTLWQGGTDHAGIATQMVVERQLEAQGLARKEMGREAFVEKVWEWKEESGNTISRQMRRLGASIDWSRERFTMDEGLSEAVKEVFIQLYDEGLIYRGNRLVNWDPKLHTAVSDLEVLTEEENGFLWHIRYPLSDNSDFLIVATTRPETLLGDTAVAVHPDDTRYAHLIGKSVTLPLSGRVIPIIADEFVEPEFGSGCVKITPAHDFNDYEVGKRHQLPMINVFNENAELNHNTPSEYQGLSRFVAREKIVADLQQKNLIDKIEPYRLKVPRCERTNEIVEPYLTNQWFVKTQPLAAEAIAAVESGKIEFVPENWSKTYFEWMYNIQDWCISRQLWWGHRIPAWYDDKGEIYVGASEEAVRQKYHLSENIALTQETDVLDTWFSSALWPFSTLGWPKETPELETYYPTSVLVTGFDIIFFWVARMIMMGLKFTGEVPFKRVYVHGLIQDAHGQKMSKSKGNILDPIDLIDGISLDDLVAKRTNALMQPSQAKQIAQQTQKQFPEGIQSYGTDALRFTFCALASNNRHIRFDLARIEGYRHFCNKLWNAARYVLMNLEGQDLGNTIDDRELTLSDKWIWSIWQKTKKQVHDNIAQFRFDLVAQTLYDFTWNHYCDWYLELSKPTLTDPQTADKLKKGTRFTLIAVLEELLRAMHPLMPFITEEIWKKLALILDPNYFAIAPHSIMIQPYPLVDAQLIDEKAEDALQYIQEFILAIRNIRGEMNVNPALKLPIFCRGHQGSRLMIEQAAPLIQFLAKINQITWVENNSAMPESATTIVRDLEIFIPLSDLIDKEAESKRLQKEMEKLNKDIALFQQKLANEHYVKKAPKEIVDKEHERLKVALTALEKLKDNFEKINRL